MSVSDDILQSFVVPLQEEGELFQTYLDRVFREYDKRIILIAPTLSEGHRQIITVDSAGATDLLIKSEHRITNILIEALAGDAPYVHDFQLSEDKKLDNKDGDQVFVFVKPPGSTNPTLRFLDQDGVVFAQATFTGSGNDTQRFSFIKVNDLWIK
jgi:hypothetical protein